MLPVSSGPAGRSLGRKTGSTASLKRLSRRVGGPLGVGLVLLLLIGATALLLHTALSDHEDPGLHVVEAGGGGGSGGGAGRTQLLEQPGEQQHLSEGGTGVKGRQQDDGSKQGGDADRGKAGAADEQQQEGSDESEHSDHPARTGQEQPEQQQEQQQEQPEQQQQQAQAQQEQEQQQQAQPQQEQQAQAQPQKGGTGSPSKFAQALQRQREEASQQAGASRKARQPLPTSFPAQPEPPVVELSPEEVARRREAIKQAMVHAWGGYEKYAWGYDELCPLTQKGKNDFGGLGATIIDSLDTLHMMGLHKEYDRAAEWVRTQMPLDSDFDASVFETIIRVVGGMLSAHDLTGDPVMLKRAQDVADRLLPAYNTPTGIPLNILNLKTQATKNPTWNQKASTLAEFGTHQLEFWRLSQRTGNATYAKLAEATIQHLNKIAPNQGLMPLFISPRSGNFTARRVSFGALGDSYYEYLLKMWIIKGKSDDMYRSMWEQAMDEMIDKLVFVSKDNLTYIAEFERYGLKHKYDHLVCFVPGMLALGAHSGAVTGAKAERYVAVAGDLTHTCWQMYHRMPSGLSPEYVTFAAGGMRPGAAYNLLRPEALEAMWYMWRLTHDWRYRTWGWEVFQAFERHCKAEAGYAGLKDVRLAEPIKDDTMQSFFLAETLKYLWLLFSDDAAFNIDEWVLNTEAHPLRVSQPPQQQAAPDAAAAEAARKKWWWPPGPGQGQGEAAAAVQQQRRRAAE